MKTNEERIQALHARADVLQRTRERRKTEAIGASCVVLAFCLLFTVFGSGGMHPGGVAGMYSGATMLFEGAGPYVLIAVLAFMAGVIVTAVLIRNRKKKAGQTSESLEKIEMNEDSDLNRDRDNLQGRKS